MISLKRVEKKVVVVTGGALGIGRETCSLLAKEGARVAVTDILDKEGQELVEVINKEIVNRKKQPRTPVMANR